MMLNPSYVIYQKTPLYIKLILGYIQRGDIQINLPQFVYSSLVKMIILPPEIEEIVQQGVGGIGTIKPVTYSTPEEIR